MPCAEKHCFPNHGRRGHESRTAPGIVLRCIGGELVRRQNFEFATRFDHGGHAFQAEEIQATIGIDRTGSKFSTDPTFPHRLSGFRFHANQKGVIHGEVNQVIHQNGGGIFRKRLVETPGHMGICHHALAAGLHRHHFRALAEAVTMMKCPS